MYATHILIILYLSVKFHQVCFCSVRVKAETRFVTAGWTDGRTDGAILICLPKFLRGHKKKVKVFHSLTAVGAVGVRVPLYLQHR